MTFASPRLLLNVHFGAPRRAKRAQQGLFLEVAQEAERSLFDAVDARASQGFRGSAEELAADALRAGARVAVKDEHFLCRRHAASRVQ